MIPSCCTVRCIILVEIFRSQVKNSPVKGEISSNFTPEGAKSSNFDDFFYQYYASNVYVSLKI
jgi:hypothetical protein